MPSKIKEIYQAFKDTIVTVDGKEIKVKDPGSLPGSIQTANLPLRLLTPISRFSSGFATSDSVWSSANGSQKNQIDWTITDLFLFDAINQQVGIKALAEPLIDYCQQYLDMMAISFPLPSSTWVKTVNLKPDVIDYPIGSSFYYYGVVAIVVITEKIN